jgi:hypothetical protein
MAKTKLTKQNGGKIKLNKPKGNASTYTKQEWDALTVDERLEILARALRII